MKKVKFLLNYRGRLTGEMFFPVDSVGEFEDEAADEMIANGRAVLVDDDGDEAKPKRRKKDDNE